MLEVENALARRLDTAGEKARYDKTCKSLLSSVQILARILKYCVSEFKDCDIKDIEEKYIEGEPIVSKREVHRDEQGEFIQGMDTEDASMTEGTVYFDILFYVILPDSGKRVRMIINVEAQNKFDPGYPLIKRGVYYGSRLISSQYVTVFENSHYEKIEKVYSIWICPNPSEERKNTIVKYSITEENVVGEVSEKAENYDLMTVIQICMGGADGKNYDGIIKMLDVLLSSNIKPGEKKRVLQEEFDVSMTQEMESEAESMCNLSQGIEDRATVNTLIKMMKNSNMSLEECMNMIEIPDYQRKVYQEMIEEKKHLQPV